MEQHHDLFACNAVNGLDGEVIKEIFISMMAMMKTGIKKFDFVELISKFRKEVTSGSYKELIN